MHCVVEAGRRWSRDRDVPVYRVALSREADAGGEDEARQIVKRSGHTVPPVVVRPWGRDDQLEFLGQNLACLRVKFDGIWALPHSR
jgi:hypothetical protein